MKISLVVSEVGQRFETESGIAVSILSRDANTSVVVQDGQTLVIGGLIKEKQSEDRKGIPFLMDIPVLGYLFGTVSTSLTRTELVMLITPHVVKSREDVDRLTEEYKKSAEKLRKGMGAEVD